MIIYSLTRRLFSVFMEVFVAAAKLLPGVPGAKFRLLLE
jgi:hypothetical protein